MKMSALKIDSFRRLFPLIEASKKCTPLTLHQAQENSTQGKSVGWQNKKYADMAYQIDSYESTCFQKYNTL